MTLSPFEKVLPWTGVIVAASWVGQNAAAGGWEDGFEAGSAKVDLLQDNVPGLQAGLLVLMGIALLFFATAVRNILRSGEAREATYSTIAHAGFVVVAAAVAQMVVANVAIMNGAADAGDQNAVTVLGYLAYYGWAGMGIGLSTAFIALGLGGIAHAVLPRWFGIVSILLGILGALGNAGIPPGGLVNYLLLPIWLVVASVIITRRQKLAAA